MSTTSIEWTATRLPDGTALPGYTFNPWIGCTKVSEGCKNCYAEADFDKRRGIAKWGANGTRVVTSYTYWRNLIKWNKQAKESGVKRKVFVGSLCDIFEDWNGQMLNSKGEVLMMHFYHEDAISYDANNLPVFYSDEYMTKFFPNYDKKPMTMQAVRNSLCQLIPELDDLIFIFCTKRPENWRCVPDSWQDNGFPKNVWVLTSVENQEQFDIRVPQLLEIPAKIRGLSMEPLKGAVDLLKEFSVGKGSVPKGALLDWVIAGGESGPKAEPSHPDWFRSLRDQCEIAGVKFFFKQWGEWVPDPNGDRCIFLDGANMQNLEPHGTNGDGSIRIQRVGKKSAGRLLDGKEWNEMPE